MPDQPRPTDLGAVLETTTRIIRNVEILTRQWVAEDQAAYAPRGAGDTPGSGTSSGDPTAAIADQTRKHRDRDRIGHKLHQVDADLTALVRSHQPRTPNRNCACCNTELATHGADHEGQPTRCWRCYRYLRDNGQPCTDDIHDDRPQVRWCECPPTCCPQDADGNTSCTDHAAEGRRVSERCKRRMAPDRRKDSA